MSPTIDQAEAGQAIYTPRTLRLYDPLVLGISTHWIWKCPTAELLAFYNDHITANHLDVGVGTGYYLDRCRFPTDSPRVALLDMNVNPRLALEGLMLALPGQPQSGGKGSR